MRYQDLGRTVRDELRCAGGQDMGQRVSCCYAEDRKVMTDEEPGD